MNAQPTLTDTLNQEADRFLDDLRRDGQLAFAFYIQMVNHADPDTLSDDLDTWLGQRLQEKDSYATDAEHVRARMEDRLAGDVSMWSGYYRLASDSGVTAHLIVRPAANDAPASVTLNQISLDGFKFVNRVLTWDVAAGSSGATSGQLVFKSFIDPDIKNSAGPDAYRGPWCSGTLVVPDANGQLRVVGKVGVFSTPALLGDYSATDPFDYWLGTYNVFASDTDDGSTQAAKVLELRLSSDSKTVEALYDGAALRQVTYHAGTLRWPGRVQNQPVNATDGRLKFTEAPNGNKLLGGSVLPAGEGKVRGAFGPQTRTAAGNRSTLQIVTTSLPSARAGDAYAAAFDAAGGDAATYQWTISGLPPGLVDQGGGAFGGTPTAPGAALVKASVTASGKDGVPTTDSKRLQLIIADKSNAANPDIAEARSWLMPLLAALVPVLAGLMMTKLGQKDEAEAPEEEPQEPQETQEERAQDAVKAQELTDAARADVPQDQQAMAESVEREVISKKVALEQLARNREMLRQSSDALYEEYNKALEAQREAMDAQRRAEESESFMERYFAQEQVDAAHQALADIEERKTQIDDAMIEVENAADELDPKGKSEMHRR
jgi:hypothetical protein